jgi:cytochrome P450 / NADPH-cytochrome P450 reductase
LTVVTLLGGYVELAQPASRRNIEILAEGATVGVRKEIEKFTGETVYEAEILKKRVSVLDLLEMYPNIALPFAVFLDMLPPMRTRQYSISSSPLWEQEHVTLTIDVLSAPALSGAGAKLGVASTYLSHALPGDPISCTVKPSSSAFHLPADPTIPVVMVAAGSGISPMRAFIQERASMVAVGRKVGKTILYYGCRDPDEDYIYKDELAKWEALGAVSLRPCFSRRGNPKYVHERMWTEREELRSVLKEPGIEDPLKPSGRMYVCGSAKKLAKSVGEVCLKIYMEDRNCSEEEAKKWFESVKGSRYATDVFG